jgi:hypothetical protein
MPLSPLASCTCISRTPRSSGRHPSVPHGPSHSCSFSATSTSSSRRSFRQTTDKTCTRACRTICIVLWAWVSSPRVVSTGLYGRLFFLVLASMSSLGKRKWMLSLDGRGTSFRGASCEVVGESDQGQGSRWTLQTSCPVLRALIERATRSKGPDTAA